MQPVHKANSALWRTGADCQLARQEHTVMSAAQTQGKIDEPQNALKVGPAKLHVMSSQLPGTPPITIFQKNPANFWEHLLFTILKKFPAGDESSLLI